MPTYGYIRVSHKLQANSGLGLKAQENTIRAYCRLKRLGKPMLLRDPAVKASRIALPLRPAGSKLCASLVAGDHVVIAKLDRAFRNLRDFSHLLAEWSERGVTVHLLDIGMDTGSSVGKLVASIMAAVAEWESRRIGERIREAKAVIREQGRSVNGRATIGYRVVRGKLVRDPRQAQNRQRIVALRRRGKLWREVAATMNRAKLRTGEGRPWNHQACWRVFYGGRKK